VLFASLCQTAQQLHIRKKYAQRALIGGRPSVAYLAIYLPVSYRRYFRKYFRKYT